MAQWYKLCQQYNLCKVCIFKGKCGHFPEKFPLQTSITVDNLISLLPLLLYVIDQFLIDRVKLLHQTVYIHRLKRKNDKIEKMERKKERKIKGGNSDSVQFVYLKLFLGVEWIYFKPPTNSRFKSLWRQHSQILRQLVVKLQSLNSDIFLVLE